MSYACDVQRHGADTTDADNQPVPGPLAPHLTAIPCYWPSPKEAGEQIDTVESVVRDQPQVWIPLGVDVTERDVISEVRDEGGSAIASALQVQHVLVKTTHVVVVLERFR